MTVRLYYIVVVTGPRQRNGLSLMRIPQGQGIFLFAWTSRTSPGPTQHPVHTAQTFFSPGVKEVGAQS